MEEAVHVVDSDLNLVLFNNSVRGWSDDIDIPEPLQGMNLREFCPFLSEAVFREYSKVFATGESYYTPESCIIINGCEYIRETHKIPIKEDGITVYVITIIRNIADIVRTRNMATSLYRIAHTPFVSSDAKEFYRELHGTIKVLFPAAVLSIVLFDETTGTISDPLAGELSDEVTAADPLIEELEWQVISTGKTVMIYSNSALQRFRESDDVRSTGSLISAWIGTPLLIDAETVGVLSLKPNKLELQFTERHREILEFVSDQVALLIERKRMLISLRESEEKYRNLVESASDGIVIVQDSRIVFANRELTRLLGFESDEVIGSKFGKFFHSPEGAAEYEVKSGESDQAVSSMRKLKKQNGSVLHVEMNRSATTYLGNLAELVFIRDVTEYQKAEEEKNRLQNRIQHAQKFESLGMLAGGIAHDFNNLLMGILGNASLSLDQLPFESLVRKNIERIEVSALRAADLTSQLLAYSGKGIFVIETIHLSKMIEDMLNLLKTSISKNASLDFEPCEDLPPVKGDPTQIRQIVMNIIINASEALGDTGGVISISTGVVTINREYMAMHNLNQEVAEGTYVCLTVSDIGSGIKEEDLPLIFDPFFTTKSYGRGLGLAAVLGITKGHKGAINIDSKYGEGTRFEVYLPCSEREIDISHHHPRSCVDTDKIERGLILFVDDEEEVRNVCVQFLKNNGYDVISASDGVEAVKLFRDRSEDILAVFMDMLMPNMNGIDAFREIRAIKPDSKVIMCSGYTKQVVMSDLKDDSPSGFIQKPFRMEELIRNLTDVLSIDA
jgi:PAS domain S-box-containing protein